MKTTDNYNEDQSYLLAKKRVDELKKYYMHLAIYIVVNVIIFSFKVYDDLQDGSTLQEAFTNYLNYITLFFWGIGLLSHTFKTFGLHLFLGANWEQKKVDQYMKKNNE